MQLLGPLNFSGFLLAPESRSILWFNLRGTGDYLAGAGALGLVPNAVPGTSSMKSRKSFSAGPGHYRSTLQKNSNLLRLF